MNKCPICGRQEGGKMESHHLKPKTFRSRTSKIHEKGNRVSIHSICHQKIHATFSESDLYSHFNTIERLIEHDEIQKFIKWIQKKPITFYSKNNDTAERKRKR